MTRVDVKIDGAEVSTLDAHEGGFTSVRSDWQAPCGSKHDVVVEARVSGMNRYDAGPLKRMLLDSLDLLEQSRPDGAVFGIKAQELREAWAAEERGEWRRCRDCHGYGYENDGVGNASTGAQCRSCQGRGGDRV